MKKPLLGLSMMYEPSFIQAVLPLLNESHVEAIEWSFDTILDKSAEPEWLGPLLSEFGDAKRLIGHGVHFSTLDAKWRDKQADWLKALKISCDRFQFQHITEHFGFMSSEDAHRGCPLPVKLDERALAIGHDRLVRLQDVAEVPVGLENLALAFSIEDVKLQGEFLSALVEPTNGFLILDLHNLYCQAHNFDVPLIELVKSYPLHLVKEIHVSGGSFVDSIFGDQKIRRDTHDEKVPEIIFDIFPQVLGLCPFVEFVILERLGVAFNSEQDALDHQSDFKRLKAIIEESEATFTLNQWGNLLKPTGPPLTIDALYQEQREMHDLFLNASKLVDVKETLSKRYDITNWNDEMINTAVLLTKKWD